MNRWRKKIDVSEWFGGDFDEVDLAHNHHALLKERRDGIVAYIRKQFVAELDEANDRYDIEFDCLIEEMSEADTLAWFNCVWDAFYDWCDAERVWVTTFKAVGS